MNNENDKKLNSDLEIDNDIEMSSIEDLLSEIDDLENRDPWKMDRNKSYESSLVSSEIELDKLSEAATEDIDSAASITEEKGLSRTKSVKKTSSTDRKKESSVASIIFGWVKIVVIAVVIALVLNKFIIANAIIPSGSMESTIMTGDRIIGLRISYLFTDPDRGDIVIFKNPDDESKLYIKRIIGLPGDKVEIKDGLVYINDAIEPLDEPYISVTPKGNFGPYQVPDECYFMLGDNRNVSKDSRYWDHTFVEEKKIIAKAFFRYYPSLGTIE